MAVIFRTSVCRSWFFLSVIGLSMAAGDGRGQDASAPPPWNGLLKNELVVVGQYKSHKNGVISLEVVDVLRGQTCKPGDVLPVKFSQKIGIKVHFLENGQFSERIASANDDNMKWPQMVFVEEKGGCRACLICLSAKGVPCGTHERK